LTVLAIVNTLSRLGFGARLIIVETPMKKVWQKPVVCMKSVSLEVTAYESADIDADDLH
jgi:hypothetical protein